MKPLLALDIDGPIALLGTNDSATTLALEIEGIPVSIDSGLPGRLQKLAQNFQIVWSTSWRRAGIAELSRYLYLPLDLPRIEFARYRPPKAGESRKMPGLTSWLRDQPVAIVDDEIGTDMQAWARCRAFPTLLVEIDPREGLQNRHVDELLDFAAHH